MGTVTLITGGARSGKSSWALTRGNASTGAPKFFIATAEVFDAEMQARAKNHQTQRGDEWRTIEEPFDIALTIEKLNSGSVAIIDCCTVWLGNIWHKFNNSDIAIESNIDSLCTALGNWQKGKTGEIIIVSNEVGWGIVPVDPGVRNYRDWAGKLNQKIAGIANEVYLCVAGIPVKIK
ncbi:MAG TPA: bifunctional adenosylcobinamide kinase/adenosylcobinamide-phosphate guanylyltransferase [Fibrobacteres bacterium]|jgi:adenosylcobinamide kinase / adenosylcobinamide-phosphate guanylyltransferase|nr:bifunctional adenosylcobinamide kinase/adenosylcobinamide-phosphate guanylyltransferase [Fibrobacterota bacterium]